MTSAPRRQARIAGLLYLLVAITAPLGLMVVPARLIVAGDRGADRRPRRAAAHGHGQRAVAPGRRGLHGAGAPRPVQARQQNAGAADAGLRCGFIPKLLGGLVIASGIGHVLGSFTSLIASGLAGPVFVLELGEPMMILWLVLVGARTTPIAKSVAVPA